MDMIDYTEKREGDGWMRVFYGEVKDFWREIASRYNCDIAMPFENNWSDDVELFILESDADTYGLV